MTYLLAAPWAVALAATIWGAVERGRRSDLMLALDDAQDDGKALQARLSATLDVAERRSVNLARLRGQIRALEVDNAACSDPDTTRRSLRRMLSANPND